MKLLLITQKVNKNDQILGFFHDWIFEFSKHVDYLEVICLEKGEYDLPENVRVHSLGKEKGFSKIKILLNFFKLIFSLRYKKVFVHMNPIYVVLAGWFWRITGRRINLWYTHKHVDLKLKIAVLFANQIFSASKESFRLKTKKLLVTGHGINLDLFNKEKNKDKEKFRMVSVSRISRVKDFETMIKSAELLKEDQCEFHIDIWGGPVTKDEEKYLRELKDLVLKTGLKDYINFNGPIPNKELVSKLSDYDLFLHMSNTGSLDKAALEAMASSLLVLSSNDALRSILSEDEELVYNSGDFIEMKDKIKTLINWPKDKTKEIETKYKKFVEEKNSLKNLVNKLFLYI